MACGRAAHALAEIACPQLTVRDVGSTRRPGAAKFLEMRGKLVSGWAERSLGILVALSASFASGEARADANDVKGTIGGAMLGAEVVMLTESAFRLRPGWMYWAGGGAGGLLGGYLGYEISDDSSNRPPSFLLAGGIALIIPTIMGVLTATQYEPIGTIRQDLPGDSGDGSDADGDEPDTDEPDSMRADPEQPQARPPVPRLELPTIGLAQAFSRDELARFRVRQAPELHVSLLRGVF